LAGPGWASRQLIEAAQAGDLDSLTAVVHGAHPHVRRFAAHLCATSQDAEDAAQEALIVLYRKIGTLRATAALTSWMFRIVRNECLRRARSWRREIPAEAADRDAAPAGSAEEEALDRLDAQRVAAAIRALPDTQRRVLILRDVLGHPGSAVAESLGLSTAAMKSQLHRARTALRRDLRDTRLGAGRG
jgi:RNA polymerase sigma factor (sigma-70 family)